MGPGSSDREAAHPFFRDASISSFFEVGPKPPKHFSDGVCGELLISPESAIRHIQVRGGMVFLKDSAGGRDGVEDAVGDTSGLHGCEKVIDDFVPGAVGDEGMDAAISDDFDIALAQRNEEQNAVTMRSMNDARGEFAVRELARMALLDKLWYECHPDWKPIEQQRQDDHRG